MKNKKYVIPCVASAILIVFIISFFAIRSRPDGSTLKSRELRLSELSKLDGDAHISCEIEIGGYIDPYRLLLIEMYNPLRTVN